MVYLRDSVRFVSYLYRSNRHHHRLRNQLQHPHEAYQSRIRTKRRSSYRILFIVLLTIWLPALEIPGILACGPGRGGGRRPISRKLTPLVFKQHVPNVSENTLPASGLVEERVSRHDTRFRDLVPNYNADIIFKDEEGTGADRLMTQRCKEKLNTLAISVMNQWPGVRLRVTEGWDEEGKHATGSLHYEGRAVDVTTSDRDRSKYGMLARLAVEAGFDWVYYESRSHIHCSVKSESFSAGKSGGCFSGSSLIKTTSGTMKPMSDLKVGESVESLDSSGDVVYSEVIAFLDRAPQEKRQFIQLTTFSGKVLTLTPLHLVPVKSEKEHQSSRTIFASRIKSGDQVLIQDSDNFLPRNLRVRWDYVTMIELVARDGIYAPLTREGTIVVNNVVASCYAVMESQTLDHLVFWPLRIIATIQSSYSSLRRLFFATFGIQNDSYEKHLMSTVEIDQNMETTYHPRYQGPQGIHWYANFLYIIGSYVVPSTIH
ncbi:sonic hedgehog protein A [Aphidius gifuensis]|uniref:sonic hedgehog protein A n=1 Tax=Aphidius gifuensis TaxID=684658 RepID=UPI001CDBABDF|nr:sonic hedgehog protein A [Aphidius gifuensis]